MNAVHNASHVDFYNKLTSVLNAFDAARRIQLRLFQSQTLQELGAGVSYWVEPGNWKLERLSRACARRSDTARLVVEAVPRSSEELCSLIIDATDFLDSVGVAFVKDPQRVPGAFCSGARIFNDAPALYDAAAASEKTPILFAGILLDFWRIT